MSLSCYHGEEGSTPEGRDAQFKTEEQEQNRTLSESFLFSCTNYATIQKRVAALLNDL